VLLHGTKDVPRDRGIDVGLSYGDHFFLEALARRPAQTSADAGVNPPVPPGSVQTPGGGGGGCTSAGTAPFAGAVLLAFAMLRRRRRDSEVA
jgi:Synergist-CTERM protein sorting domain-containing protein